MRPAYLEVNLQAIFDNVRHIKAVLGQQVGIIAVVKSNAYGHGAVEVSKVVLQAGADMLAVALLEEALQLREAGISAPILVLGPVPRDAVEVAAQNAIIVTLNSAAEAEAFSKIGLQLGTKVTVHLKIDTGMCRHGVRVEEVEQLCRVLRGLDGLQLAGAFTHFASALTDPRFTLEQLARFKQAVRTAENVLGCRIPLVHAANSPALVRYPEAWLDAVRPGILIYGLPRNPRGSYMPTMTQALTLKAKVALVKHVQPGDRIGYDGTFVVRRPTTIALLPLGYADGYPRALSNRGEVLLRGRRVPVVGRVAMDWTTVDVTDLGDVQVGEEAILMGRQGEEFISVAEVAERSGTIVQEVVSRLSPRLPRVYIPHL